MNPLLTLALLLAPTGQARDAAADGFRTIQPPGGRFLVRMPASVQGEEWTFRSPVGDATVFGYTAEQDGLSYGVVYNDFAPGLVPPGEVDGLLERARDRAAADLRGHLVREQSVTLAGAGLGREFLVEMPEGRAARVRLAFAPGRLFRLLVIGPRGRLTGPGPQTFFGSFRYTGAEPGPAHRLPARLNT